MRASGSDTSHRLIVGSIETDSIAIERVTLSSGRRIEWSLEAGEAGIRLDVSFALPAKPGSFNDELVLEFGAPLNVRRRVPVNGVISSGE